jgi:hypothetical protein
MTWRQWCLDYASMASCPDINYNHRRVVELLGPGGPFRDCLHQSPGHTFCVNPGRDGSATGNQALVSKFFLYVVLGVGKTITENH